MLRTILDARPLVAMSLAAVIGASGLHRYPLPADDVFLSLIALRTPAIFQMLAYGYATIWFTTPFFAASLVTSMVAILLYHRLPVTRSRPLPPYERPEARPTPSLILGEAHYISKVGRAPTPTWLTIPQRGLYTGLMILGAVGTGKTSACMYPYVDQLAAMARRRSRPEGGRSGAGGQGDFCAQVRSISRAWRESTI